MGAMKDEKTVSLAGGVLKMAFPGYWRGGMDGFDEAHFQLDSTERIEISVILEIIDVGEEATNRDLDKFILEPDMPLPELSEETEIAEWILRFTRAHHDRPAHERVWRKAHLISPDRLRVASWTLSMADADLEEPLVKRLSEEIGTVVLDAEFSETLLPADRVAPSRELKRVPFWNRVLMRVPAAWTRERENSDGTGMYCVHEEGEETGTLWVDYDTFAYSTSSNEKEAISDPSRMKNKLRKWAEGVESKCREKPEARDIWLEESDGEFLVTCRYAGVEDGEALRHYAWHRFVSDDTSVTIVHFTLVFVESLADEPEFVERLALFDREVRNALIFDHTP